MEENLFHKIKLGDQNAFRQLFSKYHRYMAAVAWRITKEKTVAQDMVQDAFVELWKRRTQLPADLKVKSYLSQTVVNKSLNYIKRQKIVVYEDVSEIAPQLVTENAQDQMELNALQQIITATIDKLPDRCRIIFSMSRFEEMSHKEIARTLDISVKTVENQITIALKRIRQVLKQQDLLISFFLFFYEFVLGASGF
ncbi:MAG: RNA polymerase sigma-70 factor [Saprospiraceae bacterium]